MFLLGFKATFQSTHLTPKGPYCIEITNIPLALYIAHIKHASFPLESKVCISYYLNVTPMLFLVATLFRQTSKLMHRL
jgi:hypothetical protein